ncbi:MAG TPA: glycosyltransferase [Planctomycetes bacterium]|nr:glycosyltransferase [Planctomycetota bacterium]
MDLTLLIPMHDEEEALEDLLPALATFHAEHAVDIAMEAVLVDDGSKDHTFERAWTWAEGQHFPVKVIRLNPREGLGGAISQGVSFCTGRWIVTYDADMSYPLGDVPRLLERGESAGAQVVTASPWSDEGRAIDLDRRREGISRWASRLYRWRLGRRGRHLTCFTCGFRAYTKDAMPRLLPKNKGFLATAEMLVRALKADMTVAEVASTLRPRVRGRSKMRVVRTAISHVLFLIRL